MIAHNEITTLHEAAERPQTLGGILELHVDIYKTTDRQTLCRTVPFSESQLSRIISGQIDDVKASVLRRLIAKSPPALAKALHGWMPNPSAQYVPESDAIPLSACDLSGNLIVDAEDLLRLVARLAGEVKEAMDRSVDALGKNPTDANREKIIDQFNDVIEEAVLGREIARNWGKTVDGTQKLDAKDR